MSMRYGGGVISPTQTGFPTSTIEYLVVAGGGSGGPSNKKTFAGNGGGAGGFLTNTGYIVSPGTTYIITVGAGGVSQAGSGSIATTSAGANSSFGIGSVVTTAATSGTITAIGGGAGWSACATLNGTYTGGSGGGGGCSSGYAGTACQGHAGGYGRPGFNGNGGGGAGSVGKNSLSNQMAGDGGTGILSTITGFPQIYAAGGGGAAGSTYGGTQGYGGSNSAGTASNSTIGSGKFPGNFAGYTPQQQISATPGTGSGGAGLTSNNCNTGCFPYYSGGSGASGIVVIRYPSYLAAASSTTGNPSAYISGPYRVYVWLNSGSITF